MYELFIANTKVIGISAFKLALPLASSFKAPGEKLGHQ